MDKYSHIILPEQIKASIKYSPRGSGGGSPAIPNRDRRTHAENLQHLLELAHSENERIKQEMEAVSLPARTGTYLEFSGAPAHELVTKSLEDTSTLPVSKYESSKAKCVYCLLYFLSNKRVRVEISLTVD